MSRKLFVVMVSAGLLAIALYVSKAHAGTCITTRIGDSYITNCF